MVTQVRGITQELDDFASEYATQLDHTYVSTRAQNADKPQIGHKGEIEHLVDASRSVRGKEAGFPQVAPSLGS